MRTDLDLAAAMTIRIVRSNDSARLSAKIVRSATPSKSIRARPHGMCSTHKDQVKMQTYLLS